MKAFDFRQNINFLYQTTRCDFKLRDQGTFFGFWWTLLNPAAVYLVLYYVFRPVFGPQVEHFGAFLLVGIVHWNFFASATSNTVSIFDRKHHLLANFSFGKYLLAISAVLNVFVSFVIENSIVVIVFAFLGFPVLQGLPALLLLMLLNLLLSFGIGFLLCSFNIFFRDVQYLWSIVLRVGFLATPIFYPASLLENSNVPILFLNPMLHVLKFSRQALIQGALVPDWTMLILLLFIAIVLLVAGLLYRCVEPLITDYL